jgi:hypothetical protein
LPVRRYGTPSLLNFLGQTLDSEDRPVTMRAL